MAIASVVQAAILGWAFFQLREEATEGLAENVQLAGRGEGRRQGIRGCLCLPESAAAAD